ncbi:MAG: histidine--tRNA ligase [Lentisphaeria bacterium]
MGKAEPLPGTSDIYCPEIYDWLTIEAGAREIFPRYGYGELRTPIFEHTSVFTKSIGDETDVVQKEMYTFKDRGDRSLTLRPEGTAGVMRAVANMGIDQGEDKRVFYMGPMFRGERPAKGRKRQFHQVGVECIGKISPVIDAECIAMLVNYLHEIGITGFKLKINSRGTKADRKPAEEVLRSYFSEHEETLCEDCRRRFETNIWRMLDCKQASCQAAINSAPNTFELLGEESCDYFRKVCVYLDAMNIEYVIEPRLVRGLDYYVHTVFELSHENLGGQDAIAGGGRYEITVPGDKKPSPGVGFAAGMERLLLVRESLGLQSENIESCDAFLVSMGEEALLRNITLAAQLRAAGLKVAMDYDLRSAKAQMRSANKSAAKFALIVGENEIVTGKLQCKNLRESVQDDVDFAEVVEYIKARLNQE